jgi:hypothetical protein
LALSVGIDYWGTGVAKTAMAFFENESLKLGLKRIEQEVMWLFFHHHEGFLVV